MRVDHHSLFYLFVFFYLILFLRFTPLHLISFFSYPAWCLTWVQHPHFMLAYSMWLFIYHHFSCGDPYVRDSWRFLHIASHARGVWGIISLGSLSLVSFHFFHPITLAYVTSCVWRPPWGHYFTHCVWQLTRGQYWRLVGDYSLEHDGWGVEVIDYTKAYPSYQWWIFGSAVIYTGAYPPHRWRFLSGWCFMLRHSQFVSSRGLW